MNEVAREKAQSFLRPEHQGKILEAFQGFSDKPGFAFVATTDEVLAKDSDLSIPKYVAKIASDGNGRGSPDVPTTTGYHALIAFRALEAEPTHTISVYEPLGCSTRITLVDPNVVQLHASRTLRHIECDTRGRVGAADRDAVRELFEARIDRHFPLPV